MKSDKDVTREILTIIRNYNLENILIFSEKPFLEEVKSYLNKIFIVKNEIKEWFSEKHQKIRKRAGKEFSTRICENLSEIYIGEVSFLDLPYKELLKDSPYDLEKLISLVSNLIKIYYYAFEWLEYLENKY